MTEIRGNARDFSRAASARVLLITRAVAAFALVEVVREEKRAGRCGYGIYEKEEREETVGWQARVDWRVVDVQQSQVGIGRGTLGKNQRRRGRRWISTWGRERHYYRPT